ncbi:MAG: HDIG domain-containing protein [Myxococcales bacterium]|nr:HDIG domain-containing protein [Myxococcales bacterium]
MGVWRKPVRIARDLEAIGLLVVISIASALLLLPRGDDGLVGLPTLLEAELAPRTVTSPRAFSTPDPDLTKETRERARAAVHPIFDHLLESPRMAKMRFTEAMEAADAAPHRDQLSVLRALLGVELDRKTGLLLVAPERREVVMEAVSLLVEATYQRQIVSDPSRVPLRRAMTVRAVDANGRVTSERLVLVGSEEAEALIAPLAAHRRVGELAVQRLAHLSPRLKVGVSTIVRALVAPNLVQNAQETLRRRQLAWLSVKPTVIPVQRGEKILRAGERITKRDLLLLDALKKLEAPQARLRSILGSALLGAMLAWLAYRAASLAYRHRRPRQRDLIFLATVFVVHLLIGWGGFKVVAWLAEIKPISGLPVASYRLLLPLSVTTIVVRLAASPLAAVATTPVVGLMAGWMMDGDLDYAAFGMMGSLAAASVELGAKRTFLSAGLGAGFAQGAAVVGTALLNAKFQLSVVVVHAGLGLMSGVLAGLLARAVLPAVEALFGYTTPVGLAAFADAEHPLMRGLLVDVPGTYHHSLNVGGLAEAGARAIGSDRLLARVGGYLHDVGRIRGQRDPEVRRKTAMTLAVEHRFPAALAQILAEQPHENGNVSGGEKHPKPRSKTSALVALADQVESALAGREGQFREVSSLETVVRAEIRSAVSSRVLDEAALELRELAAVSRAFTEALQARFVGGDSDVGGGSFPLATSTISRTRETSPSNPLS